MCYSWFLNQEQIRGKGVKVEIDEIQFFRRKCEMGRVLKDNFTVWKDREDF